MCTAMAGRGFRDSRTIPAVSVGFLVSLGLIALVVVVVRRKVLRSRELRQLRELHPEQPWMWRRDWAENAVRDQSEIHPGFLWFFAIVWNLMTVPAVFALRSQAEKGAGMLFLALFPLAGLILIIAATYLTLRRRKYGVSLCRLERVPIALGATLRGEIQARVRDLPAEGFRLVLSCVRRIVTGSGKHQSVREQIRWEDEQTIGSGIAMPGPDGVRIPFRFALPADGDPTDDRNARDRMLWRLLVTADVPGIDYTARFELPVYGTAAAHEDQAWPAPPFRSATWTPPPVMHFTPSRGGGEEIVIRAGRRPWEWVVTLAFYALWFGALAYVADFGAPSFAVGFFALVSMIVLAFSVDYLAGRSDIRAERSGITVRRSWLGIGRTRTIDAAEIASIESPIGLDSRPRAFYDVQAVLRSGKTVNLARNIATKRDAQGLAARIGRAVGV